MVIPAPFGLSVMTDAPQKLSPPHQAINNDWSLMANTTEEMINLELLI